ncbi:hypothetical protein FHP25_00115 [Vineibacter terrae]|uniref:DUF4340 domain-containing protein n=1 Tax=Vineibacter terrae TaxID=2586908 RepID=A0A5C8PVY0_9HYPH|nr:DUF4340 domain-containing protein [Vineibacter terrae]TXL82143.1 hypothetical protein FHP25_00115 [Vineibacter terrae]
MVAAPLAKRAAWAVLALAAAGFVGFVAMRGERPEAGMHRFEPAGFLAGRDAHDVRGLVIEAGGRQWRYRRSARGDWSGGEPPLPLAADAAARIEQALSLLRDSGPERRFSPEEAAGMPPADLGLDPPAVVVSVIGASATRFTIAFGAENPLGHARYARIVGNDGLWLVPRHVADAWDAVVRAP